MTRISDLIRYLEQDKQRLGDAPVAYQYFLKDHFQSSKKITDAQWNRVVEKYDNENMPDLFSQLFKDRYL